MAALPRVLELVLEGEEVTLTRHGQPVAVVIRPDRLRVRRAEGAFAAAEQLRERMDEAGRRPLSSTRGLTVERAEELVAEIRAARDAD